MQLKLALLSQASSRIRRKQQSMSWLPCRTIFRVVSLHLAMFQTLTAKFEYDLLKRTNH